MNLPRHTSVLIAGAGPSGLMMAAQLLRQGVHPLIIDSKTGPVNQSRALAVQARSLEIFRQMGVADTLLKEGNRVNRLALNLGKNEAGHLDLSAGGADKTLFPYVLIVEQSKTERILLDYLTSNTCPVFWDTELLEAHQTGEQVTVKIKRNGLTEEIECEWLVGADGAHSNVRKSLNIPFVGGTYQHHFYLVDLTLHQEIGTDAIRIFFKDERFAGCFPMQNDMYRFIGILPETLKDRRDLTFEDIQQHLESTIDFALPREHDKWFATYELHHRKADRFRSRRCFLVGDAAHIHSPIGGQGMNTGLQDAYNLAWKLAGVIKGEYTAKLLESYAEERMPVAQKLLRTTDRLFTLVSAQNWLLRKFRIWLLPLIARRIWKNATRRSKIFSLVSQIAINYRNSNLSVHHSLAKKIRAGDRLPFIKIYDEKLQTETDLHQWLTKTGFTLLVLGKLTERNLLALAKWITLTYPSGLNFYYLPPSKKNRHIFDCFEIRENQKKAIIVRPDMHIGYMNDIVDIELIEGYLKEITGK